MSGPARSERPGGGDRRGNRLLWLAAGAFAVLIAGWVTFIILAHRHPVKSVPVPARGGTQPHP